MSNFPGPTKSVFNKWQGLFQTRDKIEKTLYIICTFSCVCKEIKKRISRSFLFLCTAVPWDWFALSKDYRKEKKKREKENYQKKTKKIENDRREDINCKKKKKLNEIKLNLYTYTFMKNCVL